MLADDGSGERDEIAIIFVLEWNLGEFVLLREALDGGERALLIEQRVNQRF